MFLAMLEHVGEEPGCQQNEETALTTDGHGFQRTQDFSLVTIVIPVSREVCGFGVVGCSKVGKLR
jgi:hypothetical protein